MEQELLKEAIRIAKEQNLKKQIYHPDLQEAIKEYVTNLKEKGIATSKTCKELGISSNNYINWSKPRLRQFGSLRKEIGNVQRNQPTTQTESSTRFKSASI